MDPASEEAEWWYYKVYTTVQKVPYGRCTTYGHIAALAGQPQRPRQVGTCLRRLPAPGDASTPSAIFNNETVPWQRVINARGAISARGDGGLGARRQAEKLRLEGVAVSDRGPGHEAIVDLGKFGWFPTGLSVDEADDQRSQGSSDH
jgi:methylated-DNA-protein-cysteine methyltransferase related protein